MVSGEPDFALKRKDTIINPCVIIEVLSESTEGYDRGEKFKMYRSLESLKEYVLITQTAVQVENFVKNLEGQWLLKGDYEGIGEVLELTSLTFKIPLGELYDKVTF